MAQSKEFSKGDLDFVGIAEAVARRLLGDPNAAHSKPGNPRWGNQGSLSLDSATGQFFDHQAKEGGGVLWLVRRQGEAADDASAATWLRDASFDAADAAPAEPKPPAGEKAPPRLDASGNWIPPDLPEGAVMIKAFPYQLADGGVSYQSCRYQWPDATNPKGYDKTFRIRRPLPGKPGRFKYNLGGLTPLPYRLPELLEAMQGGATALIWIVEGEKVVDALNALDVPATCNHGGAKNWNPALNHWFAGANVMIVPDNDTAGRNHAQMVAKQLTGVAARVRILTVPGLPEKGDLVDWLNADPKHDIDALYDMAAADAVPFVPGEVSKEAAATPAIDPDAPSTRWRGITFPRLTTEPPTAEQRQKFIDMLMGTTAPAEPAKLGSWGKHPTWAEMKISREQWSNAKLAPPEIIRNLLWADVGIWAGQGSVGKSTILALMSMCIALKKPFLGLEVLKQGKVIILTKEDPAEIVIGRMRELAAVFGPNSEPLSPAEQDIVMESIGVRDISRTPSARLIKLGNGGAYDVDPEVSKFCDEYKADPPVLVIIDPTSAFGMSEQAVNDNADGLIAAARVIRNELHCCVLFVAHISKQAAAEVRANPIGAAMDIDLVRSGTAMTAGARMSINMVKVHDLSGGPSGFPIDPAKGETLMLIGPAKLTYAPEQPLRWVRRRGYRFDYFIAPIVAVEDKLHANKARVFQFIDEGVQASKQKLLTKNKIIEHYLPALGLSKRLFTEALGFLVSEGAIDPDAINPTVQPGKGGAPNYLKPTDLGRARYSRPFGYDEND